MAEQTLPSLESRQSLLALLSENGLGLVILGQFVRARTIAREKLMHVKLETEEGRMEGLKLQGQAAGFDLGIDLIFDIANYQPEEIF